MLQEFKLTVSIPYTGDKDLWKFRPNSWRLTFPRASVTPPGPNGLGYVKIIAAQPSDAGHDRLKQFIDSTLENLRFYVESQRRQIEQENQAVEKRIRDAVQAHRTNLERHTGILRA